MSGASGFDRRAFLASAGAASALAATPARASLGIPIPSAGPYRGVYDQDVTAFLGIRYARAERFAPPVAEPLPTEPLRVAEFGRIAPQPGLRDQPQSEDCLYLNVWTPEAPRANRPVMVYFHGGAYSSGTVTDPLTHGARLAQAADAVVVTVNQRLNALGYLWLAPLGERFADSGNLGQLDLICALRWVRDNIAAFGGDPSRVMVFGQSGGGAKIATLMATPAAAGLFHSAATMSGQQVTASGPGNAWRRTEAFMARLGLAPDDAEALLALPVERLVEGLATEDPSWADGSISGPCST
jgi:para-nitrobenzyl esterase